MGHEASEEADFPTADWYGTVTGHGQGNIYNDTAVVSFSFSEGTGGTITGKGRATVTSEKQPFANCVEFANPTRPLRCFDRRSPRRRRVPTRTLQPEDACCHVRELSIPKRYVPNRHYNSYHLGVSRRRVRARVPTAKGGRQGRRDQ